VKTKWNIINKESGKNKKRGEIQALNLEGKKITYQQKLQKLLMSTLLLLQKMLKDKIKIILLMMITILCIVIPILWNKLLLTHTQVWNGNAQQQKKLNEL
jgi:hypothetical protein